jgi:hypothetical protein
VAALDAERFDAGADGFGDPQPVRGQQRDQGMLHRWAKTGGHQQRAELVTLQAGGVRLVIQRGRRTCAAGE